MNTFQTSYYDKSEAEYQPVHRPSPAKSMFRVKDSSGLADMKTQVISDMRKHVMSYTPTKGVT